MIILGIDPGTARTGYAIVKFRSKPTLVKADVVVTPPDVDMHKRLKILFRELTEVVEKYSPDIMVIEKLFFNTNVKTAIAVGQSRGIALLVAANTDMLVSEYTALEAKCAVTGYGRADKKQVQAAVMKILKLDGIIKSDDANDAAAISVCHIVKSMPDALKIEYEPIEHAKTRKKN